MISPLPSGSRVLTLLSLCLSLSLSLSLFLSLSLSLSLSLWDTLPLFLVASFSPFLFLIYSPFVCLSCHTHPLSFLIVFPLSFSLLSCLSLSFLYSRIYSRLLHPSLTFNLTHSIPFCAPSFSVPVLPPYPANFLKVWSWRMSSMMDRRYQCRCGYLLHSPVLDVRYFVQEWRHLFNFTFPLRYLINVLLECSSSQRDQSFCDPVDEPDDPH